MDSLLDALTNVVGILLLILIISSLGISSAVRKIVENLPEVSVEELERVKISIENTRENLKKLQEVQATMTEITPEEAQQLAAELEEFEKDNEELLEKASDIDEWKKKVEEQEMLKEVNEGEVKVAAAEVADLKAILDQTKVREVKPAKLVKMPNPRLAPQEALAHYVICRNNKIYYAGDPYVHVTRVRDVIDQRFAELAYTGDGVGSHVYPVYSTRQNDARTGYLAVDETVRRGSRFIDDLGWESIQITEIDANGATLPAKDILTRLFGREDRRDFSVYKFRLDENKVKTVLGGGSSGPEDFTYHISRNGTTDRLKLALGFREEGGWSVEEFKRQGSAFDLVCKQVSVSRGAFFYYYVSPDSFEVYLEARDMTEAYKIPAGWTTWKGEQIELRAIPQRETTMYDLDALPDEEYASLATALGKKMITALKDEITNFTSNVAAAVPEDVTAPAAKKKFIDDLTVTRRDFVTRRFQPYTRQIFEAALAASEASGSTEVRFDVHPPEIPHTRLFVNQKPPTKPPPPVDPNAPKPKPPRPPSTGPQLILD